MTSAPTAMTEVEAPWKQRFRVERSSGRVWRRDGRNGDWSASNRSGRYQLYAWEVPTGELRQLTDRPEGVLFGFIDSLRAARLLPGRHGRQRDRAPGAGAVCGGEPRGRIPESAPLLHLGWSHQCDGESARLHARGRRGVHADGDRPRPGRRDERAADPLPQRAGHVAAGPIAQGDLAVVASTERSAMQHYTLLAFDTAPVSGWPSCGTAKALASRAVRSPVVRHRQRRGPAGRDDEPKRLRAAADLASAQRRAARLRSTTSTATWRRSIGRTMGIACCCYKRVAPSAGSGSTMSPTMPSTSSTIQPGYYGWGAYFGPDGEIFATWEDAAHPTRSSRSIPRRARCGGRYWCRRDARRAGRCAR